MAAQTQTVNCPKCGNASLELMDIDARITVILKNHVNLAGVPPKMCNNCFSALISNVPHGVKLRLEEFTKNKNKHLIWKNRVTLIKNARTLMDQKNFSEAAVNYEKYIRVLEISYDLQKGTLSPDVFGKSARSKELTIITTTFWDLLRIYDTNPKYRDRMTIAAQKLALFIPYSPLFQGIVKNAQAFAGSAKNPDIVNDFLARCKVKTRKCFIASATYQSNYHPHVITLRLFRDAVLLRTPYGRFANSVYNLLSPKIAESIENYPWLRPYFKLMLTPVIFLVNQRAPKESLRRSPN